MRASIFLIPRTFTGDGHSERLLAKATKGKEDQHRHRHQVLPRGDIHDPADYSEEFPCVEFCENSLRSLERERIDLYQIHCPPTDISRRQCV